jgi:threonine/homoserine/homoserine lactone efflux protein
VSVLVVALIAFVLGFVGSMPLAGPVSVMVVSRAGVGRFSEALKLALGASIAEGIYAGVAFWGFATFLASHAIAVPISHAVTAVVLLVVGFHFVRWKPKPDEDGKERTGHGAFVLGFTASMVNPTLLLTWSAVTTAIYSRKIVAMTGLLALPFGLAAGGGIAAWNAVLVALLRRYHQRFPKAVLQWAIRGMGLVLIVIALWSAVDLVRKGLSPAG